MTNKPEKSTAKYFAEMANRYELHKQSGGDVFDFEPAREPPPKQECVNVKADLDRGLTDLAAGRTQNFQVAKIIKRGRTLAGTLTKAGGGEEDDQNAKPKG